MAGTGLTRGELAAMWPRGPGGKFLPKSQWPTAAPKAAEPPPVPDAAQAARDKAFLGEAAEPPPLPAEPPPLPAEPPPLPPKEEPSGKGQTVIGATAGALGGVAGAVAGYAGAKMLEKFDRPIGTLEGGQPQDAGGRHLEELLNVTKQIARIGTPIKDAIMTKAAGSRM